MVSGNKADGYLVRLLMIPRLLDFIKLQLKDEKEFSLSVMSDFLWSTVVSVKCYENRTGA